MAKALVIVDRGVVFGMGNCHFCAESLFVEAYIPAWEIIILGPQGTVIASCYGQSFTTGLFYAGIGYGGACEWDNRAPNTACGAGGTCTVPSIKVIAKPESPFFVQVVVKWVISGEGGMPDAGLRLRKDNASHDGNGCPVTAGGILSNLFIPSGFTLPTCYPRNWTINGGLSHAYGLTVTS